LCYPTPNRIPTNFRPGFYIETPIYRQTNIVVLCKDQMSRKLILALASASSLVSQVLLFIPARLAFTPAAFRELLAFLFFTVSIILFISYILKFSRPLRLYSIFPAVQVCVTFGLYFLARNFLRSDNVPFLLITVPITLLITYALNVSGSVYGNLDDKAKIATDSSVEIIEPALRLSHVQNEQIQSLTDQLKAERYRNTQLTLLNELSQQLETELDPPVSAQLAVNTLERAMELSVVALYLYMPDDQQFIVLAAAGNMTSLIPPGYRQDSKIGLLGRTARTRKTSMVNDTRLEPEFFRLENDNTLSIISVPILQYRHVKGVLEICSDKTYAFNTVDVAIAEGVASELMRAWQRASYHQRLTELIQAGISLTTLMDPQAAVQEIAAIARSTLEAQFVFVTLLDQQGNFSRTGSVGKAAKLIASLNTNLADEQLMQAALNATKPFRVRDLRRYSRSAKLELDHAGLRSLLAIPIRLHRLSIGTILAFGKEEGVFFSEEDESLADLLSSQAGASIESSWLYQELRNTLSITSMLYQLSVDVIQTEELSRAAELIAQAAHKVTNSSETGIVLMAHDGHIEAEVEMDVNGFHSRREHPRETIDQTIINGQSIIVSVDNGSLVCYPLLTRGRTYGALWMRIAESRGQNFANLQTLANQAAIALERSIRGAELFQKQKQLEAAYAELEITYDRTLTSLMSALDARDRDTEGHSVRLSRLACSLGQEMGLSGHQLKALERGALLHDIGKIGISDTILHKPGELTDEEWAIMRNHPEIGARIVEGIPFLQDTLPVIRYHHERWDGSGYPLGLRGEEIPIQARIFAVADVFDALTSNRSYRQKSSATEAIQYLNDQAEQLFDPTIVQAFTRLPFTDFMQGEKASA
jgi:putative nucleotidyltransferase with HDIG domain